MTRIMFPTNPKGEQPLRIMEGEVPVATTPKKLTSRKTKSRREDQLAHCLSDMVEKKFSQMPSSEREQKHKQFIVALRGQKP